MIKLINNYLSKVLTKYQFVKIDSLNDTNEIINGAYRVKKTAVSQSITINGEAILEDEAIIQEKIIINGSLIATDVLFESDLIVSGTISITDSKIKGHSSLRGVLQAINSVFLNPMELDRSRTRRFFIIFTPKSNNLRKNSSVGHFGGKNTKP